MLLCAVAIVPFTSCSKDDDESISKDKIIGKGEAKQVKVDGDWITMPSNSRYSMSMTFYEDGQYYGEATFSVLGTELIR